MSFCFLLGNAVLFLDFFQTHYSNIWKYKFHLRPPDSPAVIQWGIDSMPRGQVAKLRLSWVRMKGRTHPLSGWVRRVRRGRRGRWVWCLRVTGVGSWLRANRRWQRGFWDVGGSEEASHAGFVRRMESGWIVGTCWRGKEKKNKKRGFIFPAEPCLNWFFPETMTHSLAGNVPGHKQSETPDSTALTPVLDVEDAAWTAHV